MKGWLSGGTKDGAGGGSLGARMRNALSAMSSGSMNRKVCGKSFGIGGYGPRYLPSRVPRRRMWWLHSSRGALHSSVTQTTLTCSRPTACTPEVITTSITTKDAQYTCACHDLHLTP